MEILMYFLKSAACLTVLMLFYRFLLEKENMHVFKRFYLLGAVAASCLIPLITFTTYIEPVAADSMLVYSTGATPETSLVTDNSLQYFLWALYSLGVLFFGSKFFLNLSAILNKIRRNPKDRTGHTTNVLLDEDVVPHTFWNYIFVNRKNYQEHSIPAEVFEHEQAHARQRHSFDILFMESLQVVFWFNPLLYFVKHSIKLNHEFLADRAVLQKGIKTAAYQQTLLAFSSGASSCSLANSINYSSIKKRFTVMKTQTTEKAIWVRSLLLLPLFAVLIYSCSTEEERQMPTEENALENNSQGIASPEMKNENDIEVLEETEIEAATPVLIAEYNKLAKMYRSEGINEANVGELERLWYIYSLMTPWQREIAENLPPPPPPGTDFPLPTAPQSILDLPKTPPPLTSAAALPPPPPPAEAVFAWEAEGAEFFFEGKGISSQDAFDLLKSDKRLQIGVEESGTTKKILLSLYKD